MITRTRKNENYEFPSIWRVRVAINHIFTVKSAEREKKHEPLLDKYNPVKLKLSEIWKSLCRLEDGERVTRNLPIRIRRTRVRNFVDLCGNISRSGRFANGFP